MTPPEKQRIFDLLRHAFPPGVPIPLSQVQQALEENGISCLALGYPTLRDLFADMAGLVELRQRPDAPLLWELVLLEAAAPAVNARPAAGGPERDNSLDQEQTAPPAPPAEGCANPQSQPPSDPGRCVLSEEDRKAVYRILWEHFPLNFRIPLTDAAPAVTHLGYAPARFYVGDEKPKALMLFQALGDWVELHSTENGVYYLSLNDVPEALEGTSSFTGKRAGLREEDRAAICRCLASAYPVGQPVSLMSLGATLADSQVDLRAMGFSRTARLLPCLLGDISPTRPPEGAEADQAYIRLEPSILRYLPEGAQARPVPQPQPSALTREDRSAIRALLSRRFAPGSVQPMAAVFLLLNQEGFGPKRYGLKGTEMLEQLGLTCRRVEHPDHPNNYDYEITIPAPDAGRPERPAAAPAPSQPQPAAPAAPSEEAAVPPPPERWQGSVFFHFKTQAILAGFLGETQLSQDELAQIARDYDAARLAGRVQWLPGKHCYSVPLSLRSKEGRYTLLSIKVNDFPGGPPWRVNFVGFRRPEPEEQARDSLTSQPAGAAVPAPEPPEAPSGAEASAEEITAPAFNRLSDRDKLEIYNILLPLNPVGVPVLLSVASSTLANHGITPQRYGYARVLQLVSDMPEYFRITSVQPQPGAPLVYSLTLLPLPGDGGDDQPMEDQAAGDQPPFAMTERTIAFPLSQQGYLARYLNGPGGDEALTEEQVSEFQTSYAAAMAAGQLVYDPVYHCYRFPLSLVAWDGRALGATIKRSDRPMPPAWYVSFIELRSGRGVKPSDKLKQFAYLGPEQEFLASLAQHAEPEPWGFDRSSQDYSVLWNYIAYTFYRLDYEGKVYIDPHGEFAAFNTGLLSRRFGEDLLAYFEPYSGPGEAKWKFVCFCSSTNEAVGAAERRAVTLLAPLNLELPRYFSSLYDTMFDPNSKLESNFMHIVRDNLDRFPRSWLHKQCDDHRRTRELLAQIEAELAQSNSLGAQGGGDGAAEHHQRAKQLFLSLGEAITDESDEAMCDLLMDMKDLFESAVNRTLDQCRRNFKLAIPCYFPTRNTMSMLLPISFSRRKNGAPCMALVAERQKNGVYLGRTVLTMSMAYIDARLLCRPSSEWLDTEVIRAQLADAPEG